MMRLPRPLKALSCYKIESTPIDIERILQLTYLLGPGNKNTLLYNKLPNL